eukprot:gnl/MRDRNA2_/MRDRNA2_61402_c0_seq1.p1 gnl/MRDRNA2_/MRDRNA2_61402_c0~~gnl/MRDRNA2_/MRDRNA2_61402_c0_seq1.p1  ORF type:complete len:664 (+),score=75.54 gnl/MRDRNA2_/MRDRNA2_61402_c0_seq1:160-1992(+)
MDHIFSKFIKGETQSPITRPWAPDMFGNSLITLALKLATVSDVGLDILDTILACTVRLLKKEACMDFLMSSCADQCAECLRWLISAHRTNCLHKVTFADVLGALEHPPPPALHPLQDQPLLACKSKSLCVGGSNLPGFKDPEQYTWILGAAASGKSLVPIVFMVMPVSGMLRKAHGKTIFEHLCHANVPEHVAEDIFQSTVVSVIVQFKWQSFAKMIFQANFLSHVILLGLFTAWSQVDITVQARLAPSCIICSSVMFLIRLRQFILFRRWVFFLTYGSVLTAVTSITDFNPDTDVAHEYSTYSYIRSCLCGVASFLMWASLLSFGRGFSNFGPLVRTIVCVIKDMRWFFFITCIFIMAFAHAVASQQKSELLVELRNIYLMALLGEVVETYYFEDPFPAVVFMVSTALMTVVMLNVLIAIISDSFENMQGQLVSAQNQAKATLVHEMESTFSMLPCVKNFYKNLPNYLVFSQLQDRASTLWEGRVAEIEKAVHREFVRSAQSNIFSQDVLSRVEKIEVNMQHVLQCHSDTAAAMKTLDTKLNKVLHGLKENTCAPSPESNVCSSPNHCSSTLPALQIQGKHSVSPRVQDGPSPKTQKSILPKGTTSMKL